MIRIFNGNSIEFSSNGDVIINAKKAEIIQNLDEHYLDLETSIDYMDYIKQDNYIVIDTKFKGKQRFRINNPEKEDNKIFVRAKFISSEINLQPEDRGLILRQIKEKEDWDNVVTVLNAYYDESLIVTLRSNVTYNQPYIKDIEFDINESNVVQAETLEDSISEKEEICENFESSKLTLQTRKNTYQKTITHLQEEVSILKDRLKNLGTSEVEKLEKIKLEAQIPLMEDEINSLQADVLAIDESLTTISNSLTSEKTELQSLKSTLSTLIYNDISNQAREYLSVHQYPEINYTSDDIVDKMICLGDTVHIKNRFVNKYLQIISYSYDCLTGLYKSIEIGNKKATIKSLVNDIKSNITEVSESIKDVGKSVSLYASEYVRDNKKLLSKFIEDLYDVEGTLLRKSESLISQTAGSIMLKVSQTLTEYSKTTEMEAYINLTAQSIVSSVSNTLKDYSTTTEMQSQIKQTADSITSSVSNTLKNYSTTTEMRSEIKQTADSITSTVSQQINGVNQSISAVEQTANKISWLIKSGTSESNFVLTDRVATLVATKIDLTGYVTFNSLKTSGQTVINGDNITAGTITGITIKGITLTNDNIEMTGSSIKLKKGYGSILAYSGSVVTNLITADNTSIVIGANTQELLSYLKVLQRYITIGYDSYGSACTVDILGYVTIGSSSSYSKISFFGANPVSKKSISQLASASALTLAVSKINEILTALAGYGLISSS